MSEDTSETRAARRRAYRREWATKTGKPESEIYIPVALREPLPPDAAILFNDEDRQEAAA